ncbi:hypothetical protein [Anaerocolumna jejuensis]|uniref:hypothetical protein n=1 Tax=Anaerocolumna jejuensis TaxID=259063 RepID=UPI003F7C8FDF
MQRLGRLFLIIGVLLLGGIAGYRLLPGFEPVNTWGTVLSNRQADIEKITKNKIIDLTAS